MKKLTVMLNAMAILGTPWQAQPAVGFKKSAKGRHYIVRYPRRPLIIAGGRYWNMVDYTVMESLLDYTVMESLLDNTATAPGGRTRFIFLFLLYMVEKNTPFSKRSCSKGSDRFYGKGKTTPAPLLALRNEGKSSASFFPPVYFALLAVILSLFLFAGSALAASAGLPLTEDFTDTTLQDSGNTKANWSTDQQKVYLTWRQKFYGTLSSSTSGDTAGTDTDTTMSIAVADIDGDGYLDVIAGNYGQTNKYYLNDGTSTPFSGVSAGTAIGTDADDTWGIAVADIDGDGDLDVIAGNYGQTNKYYLNDGTSTPFSGVGAGADIGSDADSAVSIAVADIDGDGDLDVIAGNYGETNKWYPNDGTSTPFSGVSAGTAIGTDADDTMSIAVADIDGDGYLDVIAGNYGQTNKLYLNDGTSTPFSGVSAGTAIGTDADDTWVIAVADIDGDGYLDVIAGNYGQTNKYYLNDGTSTPFSGVSAGADIGTDVYNTYAITVADIDGDGDLDVIEGNSGQTNKWYPNDGTSTPFSGISGGTAIGSDTDDTTSIVVADIDGDGDIDVIAGNNNVTNKLSLNGGVDNDNPWDGITSGTDAGTDAESTRVIAIADIDGDGYLDVIAGNNGQTNKYYLNDGTSTPFSGVSGGTDIGSDADSTNSITVADIDGDGDLDVIAGNYGQTNKWYPNDGTSTPFSGVGAGTDIGSDTDNTYSIAVADIDGDGDIDVLAGNWGATNKWYPNDGTSTPFSGVSAGTDIGSDMNSTMSITVADIDGDGDLDVISGNYGQTNKWYPNDGTSTPFSGVSGGTDIGSDANSTNFITVADIDGDGDLDVIAGNNGQTNKWYPNDGTSTPFSGVSAGTAIGSSDTDTTRSIAIVDIDGDGDLDVIAGYSNVTNKWYPNDGTSTPFSGVSTGTAIGTDADSTFSITVADIDGDGDLDVIAGNNGQINKWYANDGSPKPFIGIVSDDVGSDTGNTLAIAIADIDGDGDLDVIAGNDGATNKWYPNDGTSTPFSGVSAGTDIGSDTNNTNSITLADIDGDGYLDVMAGNAGETNKWYPNDGTSTPFSGVSAGTDIGTDTDSTRSIAVADIDGDGDIDVIAGNYGVTHKWYPNDGTSTPFSGVSAGTDIGSDTNNTNSITLADIDGDGDLDVMAGNYGVTNKWYPNDGTLTPFSGVSAGTDIGSDTDRTMSIAVVDIDGVGGLDVIAGNYSQTNKWYPNDGDSAPFSSVSAGTAIGSDADNTVSITVADIDGDGDLDVMAGNYGVTNKWYPNDGDSAPFSSVSAGTDIGSDTDSTPSIAVADIDGDGGLDVMAGNYGATNKLYRSWVYDTGKSAVRSVEVDTESSNIGSTQLTVTESTPTHTSIDYWLSNDGGTQWFLVKPGNWFAFTTSGTDLRWKADLKSISPAVSPSIDTLSLSAPDTTAPSTSGTPTDAGATSTSTTVTFNWVAATDSESGIASYYLQVGTTAGGNDILDTNVGNVLTYDATGSDGQTLYARVLAVNGAGTSGSYSNNSDGILLSIATPIPTLSEWGAILMILSMITVYLWREKRLQI